MARCPDCPNAAGVCSQCHGSGRPGNAQSLARTFDLGDPEDHLEYCDYCKNTGDCPTCNGTGEIDDEE